MEQNQIIEIDEEEVNRTGKSSLLERIKCKVKCVCLILFKEEWDSKNILETIKLKIGYSQEEYDLFLNKINIPFDDVSMWDTMLSGTIWMEDGSWYTINYDEEYMFQSFYHHKHPEIPTELLNQ